MSFTPLLLQRIDWLIDWISNWVRAFTVPMHQGFKNGPFVTHNLIPVDYRGSNLQYWMKETREGPRFFLGKLVKRSFPKWNADCPISNHFAQCLSRTVTTLIKRGTMPSLAPPHAFMALCLIKHANNFTF
jgi:hypothetical protein